MNNKFNENDYLEGNPDVKSAVFRGQLKNGLEHYKKHGRFENRPLRKTINRKHKILEIFKDVI